MYCGNNSENAELKSGLVVLGTRYGCLRKGIGYGLHQPTDDKYSGAYVPIDNRKSYCGKKDQLPDEYDWMGTLPQCLQKGVGIGKRQKAMSSNFMTTYISENHRVIIVYILLVLFVFALLYTLKPSCVTYTDKDGTKKIHIKKFIFIYIVSCLILLFFAYLCTAN